MSDLLKNGKMTVYTQRMDYPVRHSLETVHVKTTAGENNNGGADNRKNTLVIPYLLFAFTAVLCEGIRDSCCRI